MSILSEVETFCQFYFSHPYWLTAAGGSAVKDPWIRVRCLPSAMLTAKAPGIEVKEGVIKRSKLRKQAAGMLTGLNDQGYEIYYFANVVPWQLATFAKDSDVAQVLWFNHDFDFRLGIGIGEMYSEFGFMPGIVIETSKREGVSRYQTLLGIDVEDGGPGKIERCKEVLGDYLWAFGADPTTKNASRILRMPGFWNWKGCEKGGEPTMCRIDYDDGGGETWAVEEIAEYVEKFSEGELSKQLRTLALGSDPAAVSAAPSAKPDSYDRNAFGHWHDALTRVEQGEVSVRAGARHNALCSWAGQMAREGVAAKVLVSTIGVLAKGACDPAYDEGRDLTLLIRDAVRFLDKAENEVLVALGDGDAVSEATEAEKLIQEIRDGGRVDINILDRGVALGDLLSNTEGALRGSGGGSAEVPDEGSREKDNGDPITDSNAETATTTLAGDDGGGTTGHPAVTPAAENDNNQSHGPEVGAGEHGSFAKRLARKLDHESEGEHLKFLAQVCIQAKFAANKLKGNHEPLAATLYGRLLALQMIRNRGLSVPRWEKRGDGAAVLRPLALDGEQIKAFVAEYFCAVAVEVIRRKTKLLELKVIKDQGAKFVVGFAAKGELLTGVTKMILGKITLAGGEVSQPNNVIVFQNGVFDLVDGKFVEDGEKQWFEQARWNMPHPIACWFVGQAATNGSAEKRWQVPTCERFERYLSDTFPGEENAATREKLVPRVVGYCMNVGNPFQKFFAFMGSAGAGKGVFCELLEEITGGWNSIRVRYASLGDPWGFGPFEGRSLAIAEEAENADKAVHEDAMSAIKSYTGSERFSLRKMHQDERTVPTTAKIIVTANKDFPVTDASGALQRRLVCLWFGQPRPAEDQIDNLGRQLFRGEGDRIASGAAVALWQGWKERAAIFQITDSAALSEGRQRIEGMVAPVLQFCRECVVAAPGENLPAGVLARVVKVLLKYDKIGKFSGRPEKNIKDSMMQLGYRHIKGEDVRSYMNCTIKKESLFRFSELNSETFSTEFMLETRANRVAAKAMLGLDYPDTPDADDWNLNH